MSARGRQPDPALGIFETLLVVRGEPVELDAHLARLATSLADLYGAQVPAEAAERVRAAAVESELGRLRLTAVPNGSALDLDVGVRPVDPQIMFPAAENGARLRATDRPGGHGPYKWVDRPGMDRAETGAGLLIRDDEELLEAGWANLFAVREGTLWTPAADGRILPGMARAAVQEIARGEEVETHEGPLHRDDLLTADEVFLTNSVRGVEPAVELDGARLPGCGPLSRRLADALRRRWDLPDDSDAPPAAATAPIADQLSR